MMRRCLLILQSLLLILLCFAGCDRNKPVTLLPDEEDAGHIKAAVLYDGKAEDQRYLDTYSHLEQSLIINIIVEKVDVSEEYNLDGYDILYPDTTIMTSVNAENLKEDITRFTEDGGSVFLNNAFWDFFDAEYIGAKKFVKLNEYPKDLTFPSLGNGLSELSEIISDFAILYTSYSDFDRLSTYDYGYAMVPSKATALVKYGDLALYTMNKFGKGYVFFTNPLLPNQYSINGFSLENRSDKQVSLANTTASANQLLVNAFASFISKQLYGYSIKRVFGSFGRPSIAWELHYEEITGFENKSSIIFAELCKEYLQVPSYTLIRNTYWWFLRAESVTYLLNEDNSGGFSYSMDLYENAYSSGTHIVSGNEWLSLGKIEKAGSYFVDYPEYDFRAYPYVIDYDRDGIIDIFCGSADGHIYYYSGKSFGERLITSEAFKLMTANNEVISVEGYSAPVLFDINGDNVLDIVSGSFDGKIYWFSGNGDLTFEPKGILVSTKIKGQALPDVGDIDGDGIADLIVGSNKSVLLVYYGALDSEGELSFSSTRMSDISSLCEDLGTWLSPRVVDLNSDSKNDLAVGVFDGYIARLISGNNGFMFDGYITTDEMNYKGNNNIKFGNNCVPFFADINGDGSLDLIAGSLEYGLAYPIDSEYFPYRDRLQEQIDYIKDNGFYLGVHFYTNEYASAEREAYELAAHIDALKSYGVEIEGKGTNQHTWYTSTFNPVQSFLSAYNAGLLWNSGFMPPFSRATPQVSAENVISLPFFLTVDGQRTILLQNNSTLPYKDESWSDISAKYGMPICIYYHCDFVYESDEGARSYLQKVSDFQKKHNYNFVMEDQLMKATAAAYNLGVILSNTEGADGKSLDITISPRVLSKDFALYDEDYQYSCGAKIEFGEAYNINKIAVDADVWYRYGNCIYVGLNRNVRIYESSKQTKVPHIERVNIAAKIEKTDDGTAVMFLDGGMMQLVVDGDASTTSEGWIITRENERTVFTKYGDAAILDIKY